MYFDSSPCSVCGAEVRLAARGPVDGSSDQPVGDPDGYVGDGDSTVDERICTNAACPTNAEQSPSAAG